MKSPGRDEADDRTLETDRLLADWVAARLDRGEPVDAAAFAVDHPGRAEDADRVRRLAVAIETIAVGREGPDAAPGVTPGLLGDFRTVRVIGRGGMGVVYEAVQISLNRRVALKMLPMGSADDPKRVRRFLVESRAAACLNHPNIVPVYLVGCEEGVHFFAMRFIEGHTLAEVIATGDQMTPQRVAEFGRHAAEALHHAHEQGVIHRDVKPSNLMIDKAGHLWVADFGVARIGETDLTMTGDVIGTPRYASPEQLVGLRASVDHRTDVYSLGCTLYEWLAGRPAFEGEDRIELIRTIVADEPPPLRRLDPAIPRDLETIVGKAMAKDPAERYATCRVMAEDLDRFLADRPILARPPGLIGWARKWARRHRKSVLAAASLLIASLIGLGYVASTRVEMLRRHNAELRIALDRADRHERETKRLLHDSQMRLAQQSLESGQAEFAQELLDRMAPAAGEEDPRGFEWHLLNKLSHREVSGFEALGYHLAVSSDGKTLGYTGKKGSVGFWDLANWKELWRTQDYPTEGDGIAASPDGKRFVVYSDTTDSVAHAGLLDPLSRRELGIIPGLDRGVADAVFSSNGHTLALMLDSPANDSRPFVALWDLSRKAKAPTPEIRRIEFDQCAFAGRSRFVTAERSGPVILRNLGTGEIERELPIRIAPNEWIAIAPDARTLAVSKAESYAFWDLESDRPLGTVSHPHDHEIQFSADGDRASSSPVDRERSDGWFLIVDIRTKPRVVPLEGMSGRELKHAFSPDGKVLAAGGIRLPVTLWDADTGRKLDQFPIPVGRVWSLTFTPDGSSLIFGSEDERIRSWHLMKDPSVDRKLKASDAEVWSLTYTFDGSTLISAGDDSKIRLWDPVKCRVKATLKGHTALVTSIALGPDGSTLASASFDRTIRIWELPTGRQMSVLRGHTDRVRTVSFSPDGRLVGSGSSDGTVRLWDVRSGNCLHVFRSHTEAVRDLAIHPGGKIAISASDDRTLRVWSLEEGRELRTIPCPKHNAALEFSPDGTLLALGDDWGNVAIWDVATWTRRTYVKGSDAIVFGLAFSKDGRSLAAACGDAKVRLWDPTTGQVTLVLDGFSTRVNAVSFAPNGKSLAAASHDGTIRIWDAK